MPGWVALIWCWRWGLLSFLIVFSGQGHFAQFSPLFARLRRLYLESGNDLCLLHAVLARRSAACGEVEKTAERLVDEADEREYQQWRVLRRYGHVALDTGGYLVQKPGWRRRRLIRATAKPA
jgi:hypothetical protein